MGQSKTNIWQHFTVDLSPVHCQHHSCRLLYDHTDIFDSHAMNMVDFAFVPVEVPKFPNCSATDLPFMFGLLAQVFGDWLFWFPW